MTGFRAWRRRLRFGLPTVLGLDQQAFLIPYRYEQEQVERIASDVIPKLI